MAFNAHNGFDFGTPARARTLQIPRLSPGEESDSELDGTSPCRLRNIGALGHSKIALQDVSSRANIQANMNHLDDMVADLTESCHISAAAKPYHRNSNYAVHAGRAGSLPYPQQLFRSLDLPPVATRSATTSTAPSSSPLLSPFDSPVSPGENHFDALDSNRGRSDLHVTPSTASLVSPSLCTELESELGTEVETDMDSETEPDTEAEQDSFLTSRQQQQQQQQQYQSQNLHSQLHQPKMMDRAQFFKQPNTAYHQNNQAMGSATTSSSSQVARDASTPLFRPQYMHHAANKSAIGISFTAGKGDNEEEDDMFNEDSTSPAPASRAFRASFSRTRVWVPPAKVRRTQSMFATPEQLLHEELGQIERPMNRLGQPQDNKAGILGDPACPLPTYAVKQDPFKRIDHKTLCQLLDGNFSHMFKEVIVIDCRFEYEYEGGHICGAVNVNSKQQLEEVLFRQRTCRFDQPVLLVFHCEHSAYRSPLLASHLRQWDRHLNAPHYPKLFYPDVVVLDGGYSQFYSASSHRCEPQNYVGMDHQEHRETCEREMSKFRSGMRARKLPTFNPGGSTPNLLDFKFPKPSSALRSASVADLSVPNSRVSDADVFGI